MTSELPRYAVGAQVDPPPSQKAGRVSHRMKRPHFTDQAIVSMVVIAGAPNWFCVERTKLPPDRTTALWVALYRRGFDVRKRADGEGGHYIFARWIHDIPTIPDHYDWDE